MAGHALFAPSSAYRVIQCPASLQHNRDAERTSNWYACRGTLLHFIHAACVDTPTQYPWQFLGARPDAFMEPEDMTPEDWAVVPEGYTITDEDVALVQDSIDYCRSLRSAACDVFVETRVDISHYTPVEGQTGSCDYAIVHRGGQLDVVDLKSGSGQKLYATDNPQLALYALGFIEKFEWLYAFQKVCIHISQPSLDHYDVWETSVAELRLFGNLMKKRFELALQADAPYAPEEKACKYCAIKPTCKALMDHAAQTAFDMFDEVFNPHRMTPEDVSWALKRRALIRDFLDAVEEHATGMLLHGTPVPDYKLVEGRSARKVRDEISYAAVLVNNGADPYKPRELINLTDAEKALGKNKALLAPYLNKPPGRPTLAPVSDPRPVWVEPDASTMFDIVPEDKL